MPNGAANNTCTEGSPNRLHGTKCREEVMNMDKHRSGLTTSGIIKWVQVEGVIDDVHFEVQVFFACQ